MAESLLHTHSDDPTERLSALLDDALTGSEREQAQRLVDACPACRVELAELRTMQGWLHDLPDVVPMRSFTLDPAQYSAPSGNRWFGVLRWGTAFAILVLLFGVGIAALRGGHGAATVAMRAPSSGIATDSQATTAATMAAAVPASAANDAGTAGAEAASALAPAAPNPAAGGVPYAAATTAAGGAAASSALGASTPQAASASAPRTDGALRTLAQAITPTAEQLPTPPPLTNSTALPVPPTAVSTPPSAPVSTPPKSSGGWIAGAVLVLLAIVVLVAVLRRRRS